MVGTVLLVLAAIIGVIFVCIFINMLAGETENELNAPIPTPTTTPVPTTTRPVTVAPTTAVPKVNATVNVTQVPVETIYVTAERSVLLNYTYNSNPYRMSVPLDDKLAKIYSTKKPGYVCTRYNDDISACTQKENETFYLNYVNDPYQNGVLNDIISTIQSQTSNPDDQARIAISMVQQIPYDNVKPTNNMRYPYMVIYDGKGLCGEKSALLAALLQRLGYGVALFHFEPEKHMSLAVKAPTQYAYKGTGYAFIESTSPSIPTDSSGNYTSIGKLTSMPFVYVVSNGRSMNSIAFEANDLSEYNRITSSTKDGILNTADYNQWQSINKKYGLVVK
jgi:hypothetical protein